MDFSIRLRKPEDGPADASGGTVAESVFAIDPRWAPHAERARKVAASRLGNEAHVHVPAIEQTGVNYGNR